jgi:hypothetical protein
MKEDVGGRQNWRVLVAAKEIIKNQYRQECGMHFHCRMIWHPWLRNWFWISTIRFGRNKPLPNFASERSWEK